MRPDAKFSASLFGRHPLGVIQKRGAVRQAFTRGATRGASGATDRTTESASPFLFGLPDAECRGMLQILDTLATPALHYATESSLFSVRRRRHMDVVRTRVGSAVEWVVAAAFLLATLAVGSLVLRELRAAASAGPDSPNPAVSTAAAALPASLGPKAVSVPLLILAEGRELHVGDSAGRVADVLGREAETGVQQSDIGP